MTMQVQIRHLEGGDVSLDDCARLSGPMGEAIETSQLIADEYVLEISSPGIGNHLINDRDYLTFKGFPVEVMFKDEQNCKLSQSGLLKERSKDYVLLNIKGRIKRIPRDSIIEVKLTSSTG